MTGPLGNSEFCFTVPFRASKCYSVLLDQTFELEVNRNKVM